MSIDYIKQLEKRIAKLAIQISCNHANDIQLAALVQEHLAIKNELTQCRIHEFEEREYLDFDDDLR